MTAGIDLALALLEEDWPRSGTERCQGVRALPQASGGTIAVQHNPADADPGGRHTGLDDPIAARQPSAPVRSEDIAKHAAMSPRNFARVFKRETGETPAHFMKIFALKQQ